LYWNDCSGPGTLETSALDGQGKRTLLRGIGCVRSLTIDLPLQTIYWVNMFGPGIGYCLLSNCTRVGFVTRQIPVYLFTCGLSTCFKV